MTDAFEKHRQDIRDRGHLVGPWRLGVAVGKAGDDLPSPYSVARSSKLCSEGLKVGRRLCATAARKTDADLVALRDGLSLEG